jgi:hypothetical protein
MHAVLTDYEESVQVNREFSVLCWHDKWISLGCAEKLYEFS